MAETVLDVEGMTCEHCRERVRKTLSALPGVEKAEVELEEGRVRIVHGEDRPRRETLIQAVEDAGYRAGPGEG